MYPNLHAEIAREGLSKSEVAKRIDMPYTTFLDKLKGKTDFTVAEAKKIKHKVFPNHSIEYLFEKREEG